MTPTIASDDESTWPEEVLKTLQANFEMLRNYEAERRRIDRIQEHDVMARIHPPGNNYEWDRNQVVIALDEIANQCNFRGYHCTRLCPNEIEDIKANGLQPLSRSS